MAAAHKKDRPHVAAVVVTSLDGRAAIEGRTGALGSDTDFQRMMNLRTRFDAVMIGAGTMRAERYGRMVPDPEMRDEREAEGMAADPLAVIVSNSLDLPWDAELFACGAGRVLIFTSSDGEPPATATPVELVRHPGEAVDLARALKEMRVSHGVQKLDCEGGPTLLAELLALRAVDELFLTIAPKLVGDDEPLLLDGEIGGPVKLEPVKMIHRGGELFARYKVL